jgi:hypothetical protein
VATLIEKPAVVEAAGQAVITPKGEWVRYSTPNGPCEYVAVCVPAFSPGTVNREPA